MTYRSTPSFAVGMVGPRFSCLICGVETYTMPPLDVRAMCCKCYGEHSEYDCGYCVNCGEERDYDSYDDDVGFGGSYSSGDTLGIPLSAMNGNAADRHNNPAGWANWVAFCEANGHF